MNIIEYIVHYCRYQDMLKTAGPQVEVHATMMGSEVTRKQRSSCLSISFYDFEHFNRIVT